MLVNEIKHNAPFFPKDQDPLLIERNDAPDCGPHIVLAPIAKEGSREVVTAESIDPYAFANQEILSLKFIFETHPTPEMVGRLGKAVNKIMENNEFKVTRIAWGGIQKSFFAQAATKFKNLSSKRLNIRKRPNLSVTSVDSESPEPSADLINPYSAHSTEAMPVPEEMLRDAYRLGREYQRESARLGIIHHLGMVIVCTWALIGFLAMSLPIKSRSLIFLGSLGVATWCIFMAMKESINV